VRNGAEQSGGDDEGDSQAFRTVGQEATDPFREIDGATNSPETTNISDMKKMSFQPQGIEQGKANCIHYRRCGFRVIRWIVMTEVL